VSEAGIVVAKPRDWWRVPPRMTCKRHVTLRSRYVMRRANVPSRHGRVTDRAKAVPGSTCRWKTLCTVDVAPIDEGAAESALVLRYSGILRDPNLAEARQRASEVGRQPGTRLTTPWPSSSAHAVLCTSRARDLRWSTRPKLDSRRQSCVHLRLGHR
jgi:hypothetical protein